MPSDSWELAGESARRGDGPVERRRPRAACELARPCGGARRTALSRAPARTRPAEVCMPRAGRHRLRMPNDIGAAQAARGLCANERRSGPRPSTAVTQAITLGPHDRGRAVGAPIRWLDRAEGSALRALLEPRRPRASSPRRTVERWRRRKVPARGNGPARKAWSATPRPRAGSQFLGAHRRELAEKGLNDLIRRFKGTLFTETEQAGIQDSWRPAARPRRRAAGSPSILMVWSRR